MTKAASRVLWARLLPWPAGAFAGQAADPAKLHSRPRSESTAGTQP